MPFDGKFGAVDVRGVTVELGGVTVLDHVDLHVPAGGWLSIVGPNGAGKSTLLRVIAGLLGGGGEVHLNGRPTAKMHRRERARLVALVPQIPVIPPGITVAEYVLLGRTPHLGGMRPVLRRPGSRRHLPLSPAAPAGRDRPRTRHLLAGEARPVPPSGSTGHGLASRLPLLAPLAAEGPADRAAAHDALVRLDLVDFADRVLATLSGGERQRVLIARALAQAAPIVLLDEPTTALDVGHQQQVLELVDGLRRDHGPPHGSSPDGPPHGSSPDGSLRVPVGSHPSTPNPTPCSDDGLVSPSGSTQPASPRLAARPLTVVATMHDLTLAGQYADRLVLLDAGRVVVDGSAADVLTEDHLARYYGARVRIIHDRGHPVVLPLRETERP